MAESGPSMRAVREGERRALADAEIDLGVDEAELGQFQKLLVGCTVCNRTLKVGSHILIKATETNVHGTVDTQDKVQKTNRDECLVIIAHTVHRNLLERYGKPV